MFRSTNPYRREFSLKQALLGALLGEVHFLVQTVGQRSRAQGREGWFLLGGCKVRVGLCLLWCESVIGSL